MRNPNLIFNGDFMNGKLGSLPEAWILTSARPELAPSIRKAGHGGFHVIAIEGNKFSAGCLSTTLSVKPGCSYLFEVCFKVLDGFDAYKSLFFTVVTDDEKMNDGIFEYKKYADGWVRGQRVITIPSWTSQKLHIKIHVKYIERGRAIIRSVSLTDAVPVPDRWVRVAVTCGNVNDIKACTATLDRIGEHCVDIALIPENYNFTQGADELDGALFRLLSKKAKCYGMYVSGTYFFHDTTDDMLYNNQVLIGRDGELVGNYYKTHLYDTEPFQYGITAGIEIPVFDTDFGKVGCCICYDSWFTDVVELLALKGAELILFPSMGFYRRIVPARAADNGVWIASSSLESGSGIWDPSGEEIIENKNDDSTKNSNMEDHFKDVCRESIDGQIEIAYATINIAKKASPHNWGGPVLSAPGGRRTRRQQRKMIYNEIENKNYL